MADTYTPRLLRQARPEREALFAEVEQRFGDLFAPVWVQVLEAASRPPYTVPGHGPEDLRDAIYQASRGVSWGNPDMDRAWRVYERIHNG